MERIDVLIIGAGPAGLSAAHGLFSRKIPFLLVDSGEALQDRDRCGDLRDRGFLTSTSYRDVSSGVGGCGLYSDGKYSFFPSASAIWGLIPEDELRTAYTWLSTLLSTQNVAAPDFPEWREPKSAELGPGGWVFKPYPSIYLSLAQRTALIELLWFAVTEFALRTTVIHIEWHGDCFTARLRSSSGNERTVNARRVIAAGGRLFPLQLHFLRTAFSPLIFRRIEVGVRIEDRSSSAFFAALQGVDPKYRLVGDGVEWRTFCCCRDGEVVLASDSPGIALVSGRADGPPSGKSNIGFNLRFTAMSSAVDADFQRLLARPERTAVTVLLHTVLDGDTSVLRSLFGETIAPFLIQGLTSLCARFPALAASRTASLIGPAIEGVGLYPSTQGLGVLPQTDRLLVVGDAHGAFRGIVAAMLSGAAAAACIERSIKLGL